jgi:hypothetical protein
MKTKNITHAMTLLAIAAVSGSLLFAAAKPEDEAQKSAEQWLSLIDAGKFAESWKTAAAYFQAAVPQERWQRSLDAVRKPLGDLVWFPFSSCNSQTTALTSVLIAPFRSSCN